MEERCTDCSGFHDDSFERVSVGGFNERVENLMEEPDGALWIVTQRGFIRYVDGQSKRLTVASGLPRDTAGSTFRMMGNGSEMVLYPLRDRPVYRMPISLCGGPVPTSLSTDDCLMRWRELGRILRAEVLRKQQTASYGTGE